jgi:hypothetical protein
VRTDRAVVDMRTRKFIYFSVVYIV